MSWFDEPSPAAAPVGTAANPGSGPGGAPTGLDNVWRRLASGVAQIPTTIPGLYGLASEGARYVTGSPLPGGDVLNRSLADYRHSVESTLGIQPATAVTDRLLEGAGSFAAGPAAAALRAPALVRGALSVIGGQPSTVRGAAALTGATTALGEAVEDPAQTAATQAGGAVVPTPPLPTTVTPAQAPGSTVTATQTQGSSWFDAPAAAPAGAAPAATASIAGGGGGGSWFDAPSSAAPAAPPPPPVVSSPMDYLVPAGLAVGAALLLRRAVRPPAARVATPTTGLNVGEEAGSVTPRIVQAQGNLLDQSAPVTHAMRTMGPTADTIGRNVMSNDFGPQAIAIRRLHAHTEGVMDGTKLSEPPRQLIRDTTNMAPAQRTSFENLRLMENEADAVRAAGPRALHVNPVTGQAWGTNVGRELAQEIASIRADPAVSQMMNRAHSLQRGINQYTFDQGLITSAEHAALQARPGYAPLISAEGKPNMLDRLIRVSGTLEQKNELVRLQTLLRNEGGPAGTKYLPSAQAMETMMGTLMTSAAHNRARTYVLDTLAAAPRGHAYEGVVRAVPKGGDDTITILRNGVEENFRVTDPALRTGLRVIPDSPDVFTGLLTRSRQAYTAATTGALAPWFAPISALYNGPIAAVARPAGTKVGLYAGDILGGIAEAYIGTARGISATTARVLSQTIDDSLRSNGFLARMMTPNMAQHLSNRLAQTWHNSTLHAMQELGAVGVGRITTDTHIPNRFSLLEATNPEYVSRSPVLSKMWSMYRDVLDLFRSGSSIQFFARNRGGRFDDQTLARMATDLTGNASTRGSGQLGRTAVGAVPYANVALQEFSAIGRSMREGGWLNGAPRFMMRTAVGVAIPAMAMVEAGRRLPAGESENFFDYLYRRMTPQAAARFMVVPIPGMVPEDMPHIALSNTMRVAYAVARDGYAMLTGVTPEATVARMHANAITGGVGTAVPIDAPPIINALLGSVGVRLSGRGDALLSATPLRGGGAAVGEPGETQALPVGATYAQRTLYDTSLNSIVTSLAGLAGQTALQSLQAAEMALRPGGTERPVRDALATAMIPAQRQLSMFGVSNMWGMSQRVSTQNQDGLDLSGARSQLQRITQEYDSNVRNQGWAGSRTSGHPDVNLAEVTGVRDPYMRRLMSDAVALSRSLSQHDMRVLSTLRDEQAGIIATRTLTPSERAERRNNIDRRIMEQQRETLQRIRSFEQEQSLHWGRRITLGSINRNTAMADLPPLNQSQPPQ